jgi:hypothetical protein
MDSVYIIESPDSKDLYEGRCEGKALLEALKLAEMDVSYNLATSHEMFNRAMKFIIEDFFEKSGKWSSMPYIHISAHGDEHGIALTNGDYYDWEDFRHDLEGINKKIGFVPHMDNKLSKKISRVVLCFSTCEGFNAHKIHDADPCPFQCLVGPTEAVTWPDALTAFQVFYHSANYKNTDFTQSVDLMNKSAGLNKVFKIYQTPELNTLGK